jgi:hypothetical protein
MARAALIGVLCAAAMLFASIGSLTVAAQDAAEKPLVNEDGIEAVTVEMKNGDTAVGYVLKETSDQIFVQNLNNSMEVSFPRSRIAKIRKPTPSEIRKTRQRLGIVPEVKPSQAAK